MKQKLRRFMAGFLAILTMFTTLFTNGTTAFAASSSANIAFWVASSKDHGVISEFNSKHTGSILYAMIDGHSAYCMNFGLSAKGGQLMNSDSNPNTNLSAAQEKLLAYCMYYGYSTTEAKAPTNDQRNKFIATQSMVCLSKTFILKEAEDAKWLTREHLADVKWLPADVTLIENIREAMY